MELKNTDWPNGSVEDNHSQIDQPLDRGRWCRATDSRRRDETIEWFLNLFN